MTLHVPDATVVWGLFVRALGVVYLIALAQLYQQVLPLAGARGLASVAQKLAHIQAHYPGWRRFAYFPTLLWLNASDRMLKGMVLAGSGAALLVIYGGPYALLGLLICWLVYQSLDIAVGMSYPWDCLLLEAGFLALFLPNLPPLPQVAMASAPLPLVAWAYRWLFFRVLFGFGKYKFMGGSLLDKGYFQSFMVNIPLPTYLAWYAYRLPAWVFQAVLWVAFLVEIVLPFGVFFTGDTRIVVAVATVGLMIGIQLISNFGFFNVLTIVLCLTLLDRSASLFDTSLATVITHPVTYTVLGLWALGGLINLPFNSWCTFTWLYWPSLQTIRLPGVQPVLAFYRALLRFRLVHTYGVFPPTSGPPIRWVPVMEGSPDGGRTWLPYEYRYTPTTETSPPRFVAPYHPRFDHAIFYETYGTNDANFIWSTMGGGNPFDFAHSSTMDCLMQQLLMGEPGAQALFRNSPFKAENLPTQVRMMLYRFQPTTFAERQKTGHWWHKTLVSTHLPATGPNKRKLDQRWAIPENFHPDATIWQQRTPTLQALLANASDDSVWPAWVAATNGLSVGLDEFWNKWIESIRTEGPVWANMPNAVSRMRARYTARELQDLETMLNRLALLLLARLKPYLSADASSKLAEGDPFRLALFAHHIIGKGSSAYTAVWLHPAGAMTHATDFNAEESFYYLGLFWFDTLVFQARKLRLAIQISEVKALDGLPGFLTMIPFVSQQFYDPADEQLPTMSRHPATGQWAIVEPAPAQHHQS
ncbi:lipase maturation factor family protein [Fibrella arboris]|uniref:lipase maturation factor family protein n=1 Tax=Fibrella arboris TaxID=3242486 RepID=UPI0035216D12